MADETMGGAAADASAEPDDMSAGYVIEVTVKMQDGGPPIISLSVEPLSEESTEESAAGGQDDATGGDQASGDSEDGQTVGSGRDAGKLVEEIIKNSGQIGGNPDRQAMASEVWGKNGQ